MTTLAQFLEAGVRYHPRYLPSGNSDHLPMTLCAISGLGGDLRHFTDYRAQYIARLQDAPVAQPHRAWRQAIGQQDQYPALFAWFRAEVGTHGIDRTVATYLPEFLPGLAMEAFHPVIRLAYAIDFDCAVETAAALAYLVASHIEVPIDTNRVIDLESELRKQIANGPRQFQTPQFSRGIIELIETNQYPTGRTASIGECASAALDIYRSTRNFFALHMVTAAQAVRICARLVDEDVAQAALTGSLLASHLVVGSPEFDRDVPAELSHELDPEHRYKIAWVCQSEYEHYGDPRYQEELTSMRSAGLIPLE